MDNYIAHNAMLTEMMAADHELIMALKKEIQTLKGRQWVGLTDDEITELRLQTLDAVATNYVAYRAIEAKLREKNSCS